MWLIKSKRWVLRICLYLFYLFLIVNMLLGIVITTLFRNGTVNTGYASIITTDERLGHFQKPSKKAYDVFPDSSRFISLCTNENGFRVPCGRVSRENKEAAKHKFLFLGASPTFGFLVPADSIFAALISKRFNAEYLNAGVGGVGFAQMLLLAEQWIPAYKPDVVFFQATNYLLERSKSISNPSVPFVATPYIVDAHDSTVIIQPAVYSVRQIYDLVNKIYDSRKFGVFDWIACSLKMTFAFINMEFQLAGVQLKLITGKLSHPTAADDQVMLDAILSRIKALCRSHHAELVIVGIGYLGHQISDEYYYVDTDKALIDYANNAEVHYDQLYYHYAKGDTIPVEKHQNQFAHKLIADTVVGYMEKVNFVETD